MARFNWMVRTAQITLSRWWKHQVDSRFGDELLPLDSASHEFFLSELLKGSSRNDNLFTSNRGKQARLG